MGSDDSRWQLFDDSSRYVDRFGLLLVITAMAVITLSLVDLTRGLNDVVSDLGLLAVSVFVAATLLLALRAAGVSRRYRLIADIVLLIGVLLTVVAVSFLVFTEAEGLEGLGLGNGFAVPIPWVVLSLLAPLLVITRLLRHQRATLKTLLGALSAYLLIALAFNFSYLTLDTPDHPFFGEPEPTTSFMYFSLVTITTLGYGDLAAAEPLGRLLATIEAVVGQVYLVTFVAMIVGLIVEQRPARTEDED